jgi:hypothetical protein
MVLQLLGVLFVGLKLTDHIDWSWWLVTLPFWGWMIFVPIGGLVLATEWIFEKIKEFFK